MMEVLVFVDGVDAMTSKVMQARRNYVPSEMLLNEQVGVRDVTQLSAFRGPGSSAAWYCLSVIPGRVIEGRVLIVSEGAGCSG